MNRIDAILELARIQARELPLVERVDMLESMRYEDWTAARWGELDSDLRAEVSRGVFEHSPDSQRYDVLLAISLAHGHRGSTNEYLLNELSLRGVVVSELIGVPDRLCPCPCCGRCTLDAHGEYEICPVCWWEDDGSEDESHSGPNGGIVLREARQNFLQCGVFDPQRVDLLPHCHQPDRYIETR
jgi:hypothetical protein